MELTRVLQPMVSLFEILEGNHTCLIYNILREVTLIYNFLSFIQILLLLPSRAINYCSHLFYVRDVVFIHRCFLMW